MGGYQRILALGGAFDGVLYFQGPARNTASRSEINTLFRITLVNAAQLNMTVARVPWPVFKRRKTSPERRLIVCIAIACAARK
jgi:hypothetical protein